MKRILIAGIAGLALSACATKPEPVVETPPPVQEAPPEVFEPEPTPPPVVAPPPMTEVLPDPNLPIPGSPDDFAYQSGGEPRVFFGYDQYGLSPEARDVLRRQANWLNIYQDATATIEGHADERGTREYNLALGARRATV